MFDAPTMGILPSSRLCRVHLFRHGEVEGPRGRVCRGQSDDALSATGLAQSRAVATWASRFLASPETIVTSDLVRCTTMAEAIAATVAPARRDALAAPAPSPVRRERALREQDMGRWDGRTWEDITTEDSAGTLAYWDDYVDGNPHGGESFRALYDRVTTWWDGQGFEGRVVVVTHIGVIRALVCHWLGLGPDQGLRWAPGYATHTEVLLAEAGAVVERFGERVA